jgi:hypothetical protein
MNIVVDVDLTNGRQHPLTQPSYIDVRGDRRVAVGKGPLEPIVVHADVDGNFPVFPARSDPQGPLNLCTEASSGDAETYGRLLILRGCLQCTLNLGTKTDRGNTQPDSRLLLFGSPLQSIGYFLTKTCALDGQGDLRLLLFGGFLNGIVDLTAKTLRVDLQLDLGFLALSSLFDSILDLLT